MIDRRHLLFGGLAAWPGLGHARGTTILPIELGDIGTPIVSLTLGKAGPYRFMIDTGASLSGMHDILARRAGLRQTGEIPVTAYGGRAIVKLYRAEDILFGGLYRQSSLLLTGYGNLPLTGVDGLLGAGFLTLRPSLVDFERRQVRLYDDTPELDGFHQLETDLLAAPMGSEDRILLKVSLAGRPLRLMVDTGAASEITLYSHVVQRHGLWTRYAVLADGTRKGITGHKVKQRVVRMQDFDLGPYHIATTPVTLTHPEAGASDTGYDGLIGIRTLRQFSVAFTGGKGLAVQAAPGYRASKVDPWAQAAPKLSR